MGGAPSFFQSARLFFSRKTKCPRNNTPFEFDRRVLHLQRRSARAVAIFGELFDTVCPREASTGLLPRGPAASSAAPWSTATRTARGRCAPSPSLTGSGAVLGPCTAWAPRWLFGAHRPLREAPGWGCTHPHTTRPHAPHSLPPPPAHCSSPRALHRVWPRVWWPRSTF